MRVAIVVLLLAGTRASADTEIHRCLLEDGTIAFQEMRCTERTAEANDGNESTESRSTGEKPVADDDMFDFVNPFDEPARPRRPPNQSCPNRYRRTAPSARKRRGTRSTPSISKYDRPLPRRKRARITLQSCSH